MKKADVLDLIKFHMEGREMDFRNKSIDIAREFDSIGDHQLSQYIMGILSKNVNTLIPQDYQPYAHNEMLTPVSLDIGTFTLPEEISKDLKGIINAINNDIGINKFLFIGASGTGKTESTKHIAKILNRQLLMVNFEELIDSKLGKTAKNLSQLFKEINNLPNPNQVIILFDEIDAIVLDRINSNDSREMGRVTSSFLKFMDNVNSNISIIATTNLYQNLDEAISRRFDAKISFDRYKLEDKVTIAEVFFDNFSKKFPNISKDSRLFKKIIRNAPQIPNPGELINQIRISLAFSDPEDKYDYLKRIFTSLHGDNLNIQYLNHLNFTVREIGVLLDSSKSSVSRKINELKGGN